MYCVYFMWSLLLLGVTVEATHFRGGTITWKPVNNNVTAGSKVSIIITQTYTWTKAAITCNSSMIAAQSPIVNLAGHVGYGLNLTCIANCATAGGYVGNELPITGPCIDTSTALDLTVSQRLDTINLNASSHFTAAFYAPTGNWQALTLGASIGWSISCIIDLRVRSDNGLINTPPVATCISYISIPVNITQTIQIPVLDADNDYLRCRFANGTSECYNTCAPISLPTGTTLSSSCTLTITGKAVGNYYLVAAQVEDFMTNTSITSMSSVPIQFLIYVYAAPSCTLKPILIGSLNDGDCHGAQVGISFTMTLTTINQCGSGRIINGIATLSFPTVNASALVQSVTNTSLWSMTVTWTPTVNEVGSEVFCAVASDNASVQSNQYCITLYVGLTSIPLCPGATAAPTTMLTTIQTSAAQTSAAQGSAAQASAAQTSAAQASAAQASAAQTITSATAQATSLILSWITSTELSVATITNATTNVKTSQERQDSTDTSTMTPITSSPIVEISTLPINSSSSSTGTTSIVVISTTIKPKSTINWALLVSLSLLGLLLALCMSFCCWYHLFGPGASRRRQKMHKDIENNLDMRRQSKGLLSKLLRRRGPEQNDEPQRNSDARTTSISLPPTSTSMIGINQRQESLLGNQENATVEPSDQKAVDPPRKSEPSVTVHRIDRRDEVTQPLPAAVTPKKNLARVLVISEDSPDLLTAPPSASAMAKTNRSSVIKIPRPTKSFVEPHPTTATVTPKENLAQLSMIVEDSSGVFIVPPSSSAMAKTNRTNVIKIPRPTKSFVESHPRTSTVTPKENIAQLSMISDDSPDVFIVPPSASAMAKTSRTNVIKIPRPTKSFVEPYSTTPTVTPKENLVRVSLISKDSPDVLTVPSSTSAMANTNRISVIKLSRPSKSFADPNPTTSIVNVKLVHRKSHHSDLNISRQRRTSQRRASSVCVSRIKR